MYKIKHKLFAYGTLEIKKLMFQVTGVHYESEPAILKDFARYLVKDKPYPALVYQQGELTEGQLYRHISKDHLDHLDEYEGCLYDRIEVTVETGNGKPESAWVYIIKDQYKSLLSKKSWDRRAFQNKIMNRYMADI